MTHTPPGPDELLATTLGEPRRAGTTVWVTLLPIVDEPRDEEVDQAALQLVSQYENIVLDFSSVSNIGSDWLRLLKRMSVEGDQQGVRVEWYRVPEIVRKTAYWLSIESGLHFDDAEKGD